MTEITDFVSRPSFVKAFQWNGDMASLTSVKNLEYRLFKDDVFVKYRDEASGTKQWGWIEKGFWVIFNDQDIQKPLPDKVFREKYIGIYDPKSIPEWMRSQ